MKPSFNTQPPEGGWTMYQPFFGPLIRCFNTQPPEGGWLESQGYHYDEAKVSTHSRLKAAGFVSRVFAETRRSFNTQPPEGGWARGQFPGF